MLQYNIQRRLGRDTAREEQVDAATAAGTRCTAVAWRKLFGVKCFVYSDGTVSAAAFP